MYTIYVLPIYIFIRNHDSIELFCYVQNYRIIINNQSWINIWAR